MLPDLRECFEAYERSLPTFQGAVNWTAFKSWENQANKNTWDKSKNLAFADKRHGNCDS